MIRLLVGNAGRLLSLIGTDKVKALGHNPSIVLAKPFRKWIFNETKVQELLAACSA